MRLSDHINGAVSGEVINRAEQQGRIVPAVAEQVITRGTQESANLAGGVVMVDVKRIIPSVLAGIDSVTDRAATLVGDNHGVVLGQSYSVNRFEISGFLNTCLATFKISRLHFNHISDGWSSILDLTGTSLRVLVAKYKMLAHFSAVKVFPAELTWPEYPHTRFYELLTLSFGAALCVPIGMFNLMASATAMCDAGWRQSGANKVRLRFDGLTGSAYMLRISKARYACAAITPMACEVHALNSQTTPSATNYFRALHLIAFGTLASMISRRTAPESVIDQASASRSSFSRTDGSTLNTIFSDFCGMVGIRSYNGITAKAVSQSVNYQKGEILATASC